MVPFEGGVDLEPAAEVAKRKTQTTRSARIAPQCEAERPTSLGALLRHRVSVGEVRCGC